MDTGGDAFFPLVSRKGWGPQDEADPSLWGSKEGVPQQFVSDSDTGEYCEQQWSGPLPRAADTEPGLEARTFS